MTISWWDRHESLKIHMELGKSWKDPQNPRGSLHIIPEPLKKLKKKKRHQQPILLTWRQWRRRRRAKNRCYWPTTTLFLFFLLLYWLSIESTRWRTYCRFSTQFINDPPQMFTAGNRLQNGHPQLQVNSNTIPIQFNDRFFIKDRQRLAGDS